MAKKEDLVGTGGELIQISSFEGEWKPSDYLNEFYRYPEVVEDEILAVRHQVDFSRKYLNPNEAVLEFGSGPTVHRALVVAPYVSEIHIADYLPSNLLEAQRWVNGEEGRHNWEHYTRYILQCEGITQPTDAQIAEREEMARSKITKFFHADANNENPLGQETTYQHVYSGFCADSATSDKDTWKRYMKNISSLVAPGGTFWVGALRKTKFYRSGSAYFPSADIDEFDLKAALELDFSPESITIDVEALPNMEEHGYQGILLAHAKKGQ